MRTCARRARRHADLDAAGVGLEPADSCGDGRNGARPRRWLNDAGPSLATLHEAALRDAEGRALDQALQAMRLIA